MLKKTAGFVTAVVFIVVGIVLVGSVTAADHQTERVVEENFDAAQVQSAEAARWVAKGQFYANLAEAQRQRSIEADAARWAAKAEYYTGLFIDPAQVVEAETARWVAKGQFYANLTEVQRQRSIEADAARWVAKAEYYTDLVI